MPRRPRIHLAGLPLHLVQRGVNREPFFFAEEDYHCYLHWLQKSAADWDCAIHAYVLMTKLRTSDLDLLGTSCDGAIFRARLKRALVTNV
jgi:hypothetical protein